MNVLVVLVEGVEEGRGVGRGPCHSGVQLTLQLTTTSKKGAYGNGNSKGTIQAVH